MALTPGKTGNGKRGKETGNPNKPAPHPLQTNKQTAMKLPRSITVEVHTPATRTKTKETYTRAEIQAAGFHTMGQFVSFLSAEAPNVIRTILSTK